MGPITFEANGTVISGNGNSTFAPDLMPPGSLIARVAGAQNLSVLVRVTAIGGTSPSLTIEVQWSNDGTNFASAATPDTFTAITAVGNVVKAFPIKGRFARLKYTITGTGPSETVDITGVAV